MSSRLVFFLILICCAKADQLDAWHWRRPLPQGNALRGVATDGNQFIAVGHHGTIIRSIDGSNWVVVPYADMADLYFIEYLDGRWFAAGSAGTIAISNN